MKLLKFVLRIFILLVVVMLILFFIGDRPNYKTVSPALPQFDLTITELESYIHSKDKKVTDLKPGNESQIVWYDRPGLETEYVMLYLHGFSASHEEGNPLHRRLAKKYGCNLYLPRLHDHGRSSDESFVDLTPSNYMDSALDALNVARVLGNKVILMGCSTGATLGAYLAAHHQDDIASLLFYSPNIDLADPNARFLTWPWGLKLAQQIKGSEYNIVSYDEQGKKYWNPKYRLEGVVALKSLINQTMTPGTFLKIDQPVFMASYYKNEEEKDNVVSHVAMENFYNTISTLDVDKEWIKYPDARGHVFISEVFSDDIQKVIDDSSAFLEQKLKLQPIVSTEEELESIVF